MRSDQKKSLIQSLDSCAAEIHSSESIRLSMSSYLE